MGEFPGGLMVRITGFQCCGPGSIAGEGTEIPQAQKKKSRKKKERKKPIMGKALYKVPRQTGE